MKALCTFLIASDLFVTNQTQAFLRLVFEGLVTLPAIIFDLRMARDHLTRHDKGLPVSGLGYRGKSRA